MRRLGVLGVALALLLLAHQAVLGVDGAGGASFNPLTLAAIGFVVLTAYTVGELGGSIGLPRITGYILSGIALGPQASELLDGSMVRDMRVFNTLALGLIALTAGLELDLASIRRVARTLLGTLAAKLALLLLCVSGSFLAVDASFDVLGLASGDARIALALVMGVLGIGTSPAIILAVSNELGSKGRLTDLTLALSVVKDLVVVVALAITLALAQTLVSPGAHFDAHALVHVAQELLGSMAFGAVIGGLLILYIKRVHQEMLLVVLVFVLIGAEIQQFLHLELLLVFIAAGFVVRNFSDYGEELHHPLERVALPVFVVFFTTAGANLNLIESVTVLPLALTLVVARLVAFFAAGRFGAWLGDEPDEVRRNAWLTYFPQAGITLGLVTLAAERLPSIAEPLEQTGFAVVTLNLLLGPIAVRVGLSKAGEIGQGPETDPGRVTSDLAPAPKHRRVAIPPIQPLPPASKDPRHSFRTRLEQEPLIGEVTKLATDLDVIVETFVEREVLPVAQATHALAHRMLDGTADASTVVSAVRKTLSESSMRDIGWDDRLNELSVRLRRRILATPQRVEMPLTDAQLEAQSNDGPLALLLRWRLRSLRKLTHHRARTRTIRFHVIARHRLEPAALASLRVTAQIGFEHHARIIDEVRYAVRGAFSPAEAREGVDQLTERWVQATRRELKRVFHEATNEIVDLARDAGTPQAKASTLRLSEVKAQLETETERYRKDTRRLARLALASVDTLRAEAFVEEARSRLSSTIHLRVKEPLDTVEQRILPIVRQVAKRLEAVLAEVEGTEKGRLDLDSISSKASATFPKTERKRLERARASFGRQARHHQLPEALSRLRASAAEKLTLLPPGVFIEGAASLEKLSVAQIAFAERFEAALASLVGRIRDAMLDAEGLVISSAGRIRDATHVAGYGIEAARTWEVDAEARRATTLRALTRGKTNLDTLVVDMEAAAVQAREATEAATEDALEALGALVRGPSGGRARATLRARRRKVLTVVSGAFGNLGASVRTGLGARPPMVEPDLAPSREAASIRRALDAVAPPIRGLELPAIYLKVFEPGPLTDRRLAVAHGTEVTRTALSLGLSKDRPEPGHIIVEGFRGSGRTSFLNMVERELKNLRVIRIDGAFHPRDEGLVGALSAELGCPDYPLAVTQALASDPTVVVVDDLGQHFMPSPSGIRELEELLRIVVETQRQVAWLVSAEPDELSVLSEVAPMFGVFTERVALRPADGAALASVIEARVDLAGLELRYPPPKGLAGVARRRVRERRGRQAYFQHLAKISEGNLREALFLHLRALRHEGDGILQANLPPAPRIPSLAALDATALACLGVVARYGPLDEGELGEVFQVDRDRIRLHTSALLHAGLLEGDDRRQLRMPRHNQQVILRSLSSLGIIGGEAPA